MTVLVVVGLMNLVWMAGLALVFLAEKNWRHGVGFNRVVGTAVTVLGCAVLLYPDVLTVGERDNGCTGIDLGNVNALGAPRNWPSREFLAVLGTLPFPVAWPPGQA